MWCSKKAEFELKDFHPQLLLEEMRLNEELAANAPEVLKSLPREMSEVDVDDQWRAMKSSEEWPKG